jgi:hypothetical protein
VGSQRKRTGPCAASALAVAHVINGATTIELRATFAEAEERAVADQECHPWIRRVERQPLEQLPARCFHVNGRWAFGEANHNVPRAHTRQAATVTRRGE